MTAVEAARTAVEPMGTTVEARLTTVEAAERVETMGTTGTIGTVGTVEAALRARRDGGHKLLVPYVTGGVTADWTRYLLAYQDAGADAIEVGLPFSDPMLDGPTIQQASDRALARGATPERILAEVAEVRDRVRVPLIAMTCANLAARRGFGAFCDGLAKAGFGGLIVADIPLDELGPDDGAAGAGLAAAASAAGLDLVLMVAPSTTPDRRAAICARGRGFVYAVALMGTTGERANLASTARDVALDARATTDLPIITGFGISTPGQAARAARAADGVVVASALMRRVLDGATPEQLRAEVAAYRAALDGSANDAMEEHGAT